MAGEKNFAREAQEPRDTTKSRSQVQFAADDVENFLSWDVFWKTAGNAARQNVHGAI